MCSPVKKAVDIANISFFQPKKIIELLYCYFLRNTQHSRKVFYIIMPINT